MAATAVGAGILISRLAGLVRLRLFSHYLGLQTDAADAFNAAFRIPNLLQNLFGEGALSGAFIPVHSALRARGEDRAAAQAARTFFALLTLVVAIIVLIGMAAAPWIVPVLAPGFTGAKRELTVRLVRVLFPGAGLLVASAWCLAVLNSHRKFLLSYTAPVAWNAAMIGCLAGFGGRTADLETLAIYLGWASVIGSFLQFAVQAPIAFSLSRHDGRMQLTDPVRQAVRQFFPVLISRGAVQISASIDAIIASLLPTGAVTALTNAQLIYTLPVSLFGMSISAAELPAMSGDAATAGYDALRARIESGLRRLTFFVVPSAVAFAALGDVIAGTLLQGGLFTAQDSRFVWGVLAGSSIGLLATTMARLYSVAHYALGDTTRPLRIALIRLVCSAALGYTIAILLPPRFAIDPLWGAAGLTLASSVVGWLELALLRRSLDGRIGRTGVATGYTLRVWSAGLAAAIVGVGLKLLLPPLHPLLLGAVVLPAFGAIYIAAAFVLQVPLPGVRRGSDRGQTGVRPGSDRGQTDV